MAREVILTKTLATADADGIAQSQTPTSGTALTLNGALVVSGVGQLVTQRRVLLTYGNEAADRTLLVTGTNDAGAAISETLVVPNGAGGSVYTNQDFFTVTQAMPAGGGWTAAATLGTNGIGSTRWWVGNYHFAPTEIALDLFIVLGTTVTASAEMTDDNPLAAMPIYRDGYSMAPPVPNPVGVTGMIGVTGTTLGGISGRPPAGVRLTVTAGTDAAQLTIRESGIKQS